MQEQEPQAGPPPSLRAFANECLRKALGYCNHNAQNEASWNITMTTPPKLSGKLLIETALGNFLGDMRIRLIEAIDKRNGSKFRLTSQKDAHIARH